MSTKRLNIGLIIANIEDSYSRDVAIGFLRAAKELDANAFLFPIKYLDNPNNKEKGQQFEYQYEALLAYANSGRLDLVFSIASSICYSASPQRLASFLSTIDQVPHVLIGCRDENHHCFIHDSAGSGFEDGIRYLIKERHCLHPAIICAGKDQQESEERRLAYQRILAEAGIPYREEDVLYDPMDYGFRERIYRFMEQHPNADAYVGVNDFYATEVVKYLPQLGKLAGRDVCVLGFDDMEGNQYLSPQLSSVRADVPDLAYQAAIRSAALLKDGRLPKPECHVLPTRLVLRESLTGVPPLPQVAQVNPEKVQWQRNLRLIEINHGINIVGRDMLMLNAAGENSYCTILNSLAAIDIRTAYLYLFRQPIPYKAGKVLSCDSIYLMACCDGASAIAPPRSVARYPLGSVCVNEHLSETRHDYVLIDLYVRDLQYGVLVSEITPDLFHYTEHFCYQVSQTIRMLRLLNSQEKMIAEIEEMVQRLERENSILDQISNKDELTGIYNRRGFMSRLDEYLADVSHQNKQACLLYGDLNYLKKINDSFGHEEGDAAIKTCASILEKALGVSGFAGRIGGDEFAGLCLLDGRSAVEIHQTIKELVDIHNRTGNKPYDLGISAGCYAFTITKNTRISSILECADDLLYADKAKKPAFIIKSGQSQAKS